MNDASIFEPWLSRWHLDPDGAEIVTASARLLPVLRGGVQAMLKIADDPRERGVADLMRWWNGRGAARVLASDGEALLIERASGLHSLTQMSSDGADDTATGILCTVLDELHRPRREPTPMLDWLDEWFDELWPGQAHADGWMLRAARIARDLLADPREPVVLHGDLHHANVLDFDERGWLAIDPKRLWGERSFDYAALFANPDKIDPDLFIGRSPARFERRLAIVVEHAAVDRQRLLHWIMAWSGLSALWTGPGSREAGIDAAIFELAARSPSARGPLRMSRGRG